MALPASSHTYGIKSATNVEGAREVTMIWKHHEANPDVRPGPDYQAMNKAATISGVTESNGVRQFRLAHPSTIKRGQHHRRPDSGSHLRGKTFGMDSQYRSAEKIRNFGEEEPFMQHVIQGAFQYDWIREAQRSGRSMKELRMKRQAMPTAASQGHARGARAFTQALESHRQNGCREMFKLKKFTEVPSKVKTSMHHSQEV